MEIVVIAAKSTNQVIGKDNDLVWDLPADQAFFEAQIKGSILLTGRKSFESPQGASLFRDNPNVIVLTSQENYEAGKARVATSLEQAISLAKQLPPDRLSILGGSSIYKQGMEYADKLIITEVHEIFEGDSFFPEIDTNVWTEVWREDHQMDAENPHDYSFVRFER
jgi:dihydrofolate reductase